MKISNIKYLAFVLIGIVSSKSMAQQEPSFTMYQFNMNIINPAYAGSTKTMEAAAVVRSQWAGVENAPLTQTVSISSPKILGDNMGLGLSVINDKFNIATETDVYVDFSYKLALSENQDLYLGLKGGGSFFSIDKASLDMIDPALTNNTSLFNPNFGTGAYLKGENYYASLSVPVLLQGKRYKETAGVVKTATDRSHVYLAGGYTFEAKDENKFKITPSFMMRYVSGIPISYGGTIGVSVLDKIEFGFSHQLKETSSVFAMFKFLDHYKIGYAHEKAFTDFSAYGSGSHEIIFKYNF